MISKLAKYDYNPDIRLITDVLERELLKELPYDLKKELDEEYQSLPILYTGKIPLRIFHIKNSENISSDFFANDEFEVITVNNPFAPVNPYGLFAPVNFFFVEEGEPLDKTLKQIRFISDKSLITYVVTDNIDSFDSVDNKFIRRITLTKLLTFKNIIYFFKNENILDSKNVMLCFAKINAVQNFFQLLENELAEELKKNKLKAIDVKTSVESLKNISKAKRTLLENVKKSFDTHILFLERELRLDIKNIQSSNNLTLENFENSFVTEKLDNKKIITPNQDMIYSFNHTLDNAFERVRKSFHKKNISFINTLTSDHLNNNSHKKRELFEEAIEMVKRVDISCFNEIEYKDEMSSKGFTSYFYQLIRPLMIGSMALAYSQRYKIGESVGVSIDEFVREHSYIHMDTIINVVLGIMILAMIYSTGITVSRIRKQNKHDRNKKRESVKKKMLKDFNSKIEIFSRNKLDEYKYYCKKLSDDVYDEIINSSNLKENVREENSEKFLDARKENIKTEVGKLNDLSRDLIRLNSNLDTFIQFLINDFKQIRK